MFDIERVSQLVRECGFKTIALQFPDEFLGHCASVYDDLTDRLADLDVDLFIVGDSTFGSSIDDISAQHVDSDVLVYFGSDLSSSGSMPVIVAPFLKTISDLNSCAGKLYSASTVDASTNDTTKKAIVLYEPAYHQHIDAIVEQISTLSGEGLRIVKAAMPPSADLNNWTVERCMKKQRSSQSELEFNLLGGLLVPTDILLEQHEKEEAQEGLTVYYIGEKTEQLTSISLQVSEASLISYSPLSDIVTTYRGSISRDFRERYGGVSRVKEANIIGIIVGSMGLSEELTRGIVDRLEELITTARKNSYLFVMGRLNEAKLCNFPEVDLFCLVSNEDVSLIKPKTFHVPVVTPWELELGLGAREWEGVFHSDAASILSGVSIEEAKRRIIESLPENPIDSDSEDEVVVKRTAAAAVTLSTDTDTDNNNPPISAPDVRDNVDNVDVGVITGSAAPAPISTSLTLPNTQRQLIAFSSPALEYYKTREFQGLTPEIPEGLDTDIKQGHYGVAAGYQRYEVQESSSDAPVTVTAIETERKSESGEPQKEEEQEKSNSTGISSS